MLTKPDVLVPVSSKVSLYLGSDSGSIVTGLKKGPNKLSRSQANTFRVEVGTMVAVRSFHRVFCLAPFQGILLGSLSGVVDLSFKNASEIILSQLSSQNR